MKFFTVVQNSVQQRSKTVFDEPPKSQSKVYSSPKQWSAQCRQYPQNGTPKSQSKVYSAPKQCSAEVAKRNPQSAKQGLQWSKTVFSRGRKPCLMNPSNQEARFTAIRNSVLRSVGSTPKTEPQNRKARFTVLQNRFEEPLKSQSKVYSSPKGMFDEPLK